MEKFEICLARVWQDKHNSILWEDLLKAFWSLQKSELAKANSKMNSLLASFKIEEHVRFFNFVDATKKSLGWK